MAEYILPQTKDALAEELLRWRRTAESAATRAKNFAEENREVLTTVAAYAGAIATGPAVAGLTGYLETRFPNKDGTMLSLGPLPLPLVVAGSGLAASFVLDDPIAKGQALSVVASNTGLWAGTMGRGYGAAARAKKEKEKAASGTATEGTMIGAATSTRVLKDDTWSPEERALLGLPS